MCDYICIYIDNTHTHTHVYRFCIYLNMLYDIEHKYFIKIRI